MRRTAKVCNSRLSLPSNECADHKQLRALYRYVASKFNETAASLSSMSSKWVLAVLSTVAAGYPRLG